MQTSPVRIAVGGPRGAGKSTFVCSLERAFAADPEISSVSLRPLDPYGNTVDIIRGHTEPEHRYKKAKVDFERTLVPMIRAFREDMAEVVLGDLPGKLTNPRMGEMVSPAQYAIVVGRQDVPKDAANRHHRSTQEWISFFERRGIQVIAKVQSVLHGQPHWEGFQVIEDLNRVPVPAHQTVVAIRDVVKILLGHGQQLQLVA